MSVQTDAPRTLGPGLPDPAAIGIMAAGVRQIVRSCRRGARRRSQGTARVDRGPARPNRSRQNDTRRDRHHSHPMTARSDAINAALERLSGFATSTPPGSPPTARWAPKRSEAMPPHRFLPAIRHAPDSASSPARRAVPEGDAKRP
jgi:hypothetical protein